MISVIIPYIDEHDYLQEAVASAAAQQGVEAEIILVCNAPSVQEGYSPVVNGNPAYTFIHEKTKGSAHARNAGLKAARGEWVQYLDVDDLLSGEKLFHQGQLYDADAVVSPHTYLYLSGKREDAKWLADDLWCGLLNSGLGSTSSMLWRREALVEAGGWNTGYNSHQEYELLFRLMAAGKKIAPCERYDTIVRQRKSGSITMTSQPVRVREGIRLREAIWDHLRARGMDTPERYDAFRQYIFRQLRGLFRQNRREAKAVHAKYYSDGSFHPKEIHVPGYGLLYKVLEFYQVERILEFLTKLRDRR